MNRIGVDVGGTKIEAAVLDPSGTVIWRQRAPTPAGSYDDILRTIAGLAAAAGPGSVGVGIPGVLSPATGLVKNANTQVLIGQAMDRDLATALGRPVRIENDANCFALSEAVDGAGAGARCVFGVIIGTGVGGGIVVDGRILPGRNRIAGEWGHTPLPWPRGDELPAPPCWCGQSGCLELYISGPALARHAGRDAPTLMAADDPAAAMALHTHADRLARGLAVVMNVLDPDVIVLGGGLSNMEDLYAEVPALMARYVFSDVTVTPILPPVHGDSGGVRGAAWLWP